MERILAVGQCLAFVLFLITEFFGKQLEERHSQISSARATACYVIGKQTVAD